MKDAKGVTIGKYQVEYRVHNSGRGREDENEDVIGEVLVSSILVHFNQIPGQNGFVQMQVGPEKTMTPLLDVIAGEMLWVDKTRIPVYQQFSSEASNGQILRVSAVIDGMEVAESLASLIQV